MYPVKHPLWLRFRTLGFPFFTSSLRGRAMTLLAVMGFLLVSINGLNCISSYVMRDFMTAVAKQDPGHLYSLGALLAGIFGVAAVAEAFAFYAEQRLGLHWREWLTCRLIDRYLAHRAYHQLTVNQSIDNPDQRISEDTRTFTTSSLSFLVLITNGVLTLAAFLGVLWSITPWLVLTAVLYAAAGSLGTIVLGRRLVPLNNRQLQKEADFRFALVRLREHPDTEPQSQDPGACPPRLHDRLQALVANFREIIRVTRNVGVFTREYNYLIQILPALVVAPLYIRGEVQFGVIPQAAMAFTQVVGAFSLLVTKFQEVSTYAAVVNRLGSMWEATETASVPHEPAAPREAQTSTASLEREVARERIRYENLTLWTPGQKRVLVRELTLEVPEGKRLLIRGASGCGKTALALATAGQWGAGRGRIICPPPEHLRFLPQRLYTSSGRLRDLLWTGVSQQEPDDDHLREVLRQVGLEHLADQPEGLDSEWDWANDLPGGDQHALAVARLLLARPRFAFLDGVPWGLPPARLEQLYAALARSSISYISAGTTEHLLAYHDLELELQEEGRWRLQEVEAQQRAAGEQPASAG